MKIWSFCFKFRAESKWIVLKVYQNEEGLNSKLKYMFIRAFGYEFDYNHHYKWENMSVWCIRLHVSLMIFIDLFISMCVSSRLFVLVCVCLRLNI